MFERAHRQRSSSRLDCGAGRASGHDDENILVKIALAIAVLASCCAAQSRAASPVSLPASVLACSKLRDPGQRLRCYDAQIAALSRPAAAESKPVAAAPAAAPSAPPPAARDSAESSVAQFGAELLPPSERPPAPPQRMSLRSTIAAKREIGPDTYLISLANGQVWRPDDSQVLFYFHVGDEVRIDRHALGSYHMWDAAIGAKNWVRVTRVQ
jgi:hypothetical protein